MRTSIGSFLKIVILMLSIAILAVGIHAEDKTPVSPQIGWTDSFDFTGCALGTEGRNEYFILEPGYELVLKGIEDGDSVTLYITVLYDTIMVNGTPARVVEERESVGGKLIEVSRNYLAICENTGNVFYFGEDVDLYENGEIIGHSGSWHAGEKDYKPGLMMPGTILLGSSYYQEIAPGKAMDRARIISTDKSLEIPAGRFENCLVTEETSPLEPDNKEQKIYAPGVGLVKDGSLYLVSYGSGK